MKILWFYRYVANYNLDKWFHLDYVRWMKTHGYDIVAYGPGLEHEYSDLIKCQYDSAIDYNWLLEKIKPDVVIMNTKSRMFFNYSPHTKVAEGYWLPAGFNKSSAIPKIMIEEDSHYETDGNWYKEVGVDLLLQRHYSQSLRDWGVPTEWLPFSVDESVFKPNDKMQKINKLCFAGHITPPYPERRVICERLATKGLIDKFERKEKINEAYIKCLQEYVVHLSTGSIYDICAAKNFEIMSSGSVLATNSFSGRDLLFPSNSYIDITAENCIDTISHLIKNPDLIREVSNNGRKCILENHTNEIRTAQLMKRLCCLDA